MFETRVYVYKTVNTHRTIYVVLLTSFKQSHETLVLLSWFPKSKHVIIHKKIRFLRGIERCQFQGLQDVDDPGCNRNTNIQRYQN